MIDVKKAELREAIVWLGSQNESNNTVLASIITLLIEKGIFTVEEFDNKLAEMNIVLDRMIKEGMNREALDNE